MRIHLEMGSLKDPGHHYGPFHLYRSLFPRIKPFDESRGEVALERGAVLIRVIHIEQQGIDPTSHEFHFRHTHHASFFCILRGAVYLLRAQAVRPRPAGPLPHRRVLTVPRMATTTPHPFKPNGGPGEPGRGNGHQGREIRPPPTGHHTPTAVSRPPSHKDPLPEPLPGLLRRDLV